MSQQAAPTLSDSITDKINRPIHDLRISVIDRCNFRCTYCMPEESFKQYYQFIDKNLWLNFEEITRLTRIFVELGVKKVRLTGGEPLLRPELSKLITQLNQISNIDDLALTTNGSLLKDFAQELKESGLQRLTVSLDTLDARLFKLMNGSKGHVKDVLEGIRQAERAGFKNIKINVVVQKGVNENSVIDMIKHFKGSGHILRFIEYMDVGNCNHWQSKYVVPSKDLVAMINEFSPIEVISANYFGEVAERYRFKDGGGELGFVSSVSQPFCGSCTRARLSTDGSMITCLFANKGSNLRRPLREGATDDEMKTMISKVWTKREDRYSEERSKILSTDSNPQKIEMFQIGG